MTTAILLSTYNGALWLGEQLESLFAQTDRDWRLFVRDDGSQDGTLELLLAFQRQHPDQIQLIQDETTRLGACQSFARLLEMVEADDYLFCDQDDRWLPKKVERLRVQMQALQQRVGENTPLLLHSDLQVVDEELRLLHPSFWRYQGLHPQSGSSLNRLLMQNEITGCAIMLNRPLRDLALPVPAQALMHDWWLALAAAAFGKIVALPESLVDYRQHRVNAIGAKAWNGVYIWQRFFQPQDIRRRLKATQEQAAAFGERFRGRLPEAEISRIEGYARLAQQGFWARRRFLLKNKILKKDWIRNLGVLLWV